MYKLSRRKNIYPFICLVGLGIAATLLIPSHFGEQVFEIPAFALFPAQIALAMMLSVLFFENATPSELLRLAFTMLTIAMVSGALSNVFVRPSQSLPDQTLLLNWVQLICMNITGLVATIAFYQTKASEAHSFRPAAGRDAANAAAASAAAAATATAGTADSAIKVEFDPDNMEVATGESAKDILDKLDINRINTLESSLKAQTTQANGTVSFESLFADESHAAQDNTTAPERIVEAIPQEKTKQNVSLDDWLADDNDRLPPAKTAPAPVEPPPVAVPQPEPAAVTFEPPPALEPEQTPMDAAFELSSLMESEPATLDTSFDLSSMVEPEQAPAAASFDLSSMDEPELAPTAETFDTTFDDISSLIEPDSAMLDATFEQPFPVEPEPTPIATAAEPAPVAAPIFQDATPTLFTDVTGDLEDIFSDLAPAAAQQDFSPEKLAAIQPEPTPAPVAEAPKSEAKLFDDVSDDLDDIFNNLAPADAQKEVIDTVAPAAAPLAASATPESAPDPTNGGSSRSGNGSSGSATREVKEFGRLSVAATTKQELATPGTLKTIGQMLLDTQAIENIIKHAESKGDSGMNFNSAAMAKVVSVARGADIQAMLDKVAAYPGVDGSLVIGKDGLLIGATQSLGMMKDVLGVLGLGIHSTTNLGTKKIDMGELRQSVLRTGEKLTVLTEVGIGVLAVFSDQWDLSALDGMIDHIKKTVSESQSSGGSALPTESLSAQMLAGEPDMPPPPVTPEPTIQPAPAMMEDAVVSISEAHGGLLNVNDDDIGGLFDNVLADPSSQNDSLQAAVSPPAPAPIAPEPVVAAANAINQPVLSVTDEDMSDIFDNLLDKADSVEQAIDFNPSASPAAADSAPAAPVEAPNTEIKKEPKAPGQHKEFGRLSASSGINQTTGQDGAIKAIGRQLIDVQAVENIIKAGEKRERMGAGLTTARVISAARGEGIKALLTKIDCHPGVAGSLIVGNDGLVIASTLHGTLDKDLAGALCNAMHSHADLASKKVQLGKLKQIIFHAKDQCTILTHVAVGVLAVFVDGNDLSQIDQLLNAIEATVRG